jgi:hypothetical protein
MITVREVLCKARKLISDKKHWCRGAWHQKRAGVDQYCALGALHEIGKGSDGNTNAIVNKTLGAASRELYSTDIVNVNDDLGHEATLKMFDRAIEMACDKEDAGG